jgi:hypothetical protein
MTVAAEITPLEAAADSTLMGAEMADLMQRDAELRAVQNPRLQRPPSWPWVDKPPTAAGAWCGCCRGQRWWAEANKPRGWRCQLCHPPPPGVATVELRTPSVPNPNRQE